MSQEETGTVKRFNARKRYGFIERDNRGEDVFVHASKMADPFAHSLTDGKRVRFMVGQGPKGRQPRKFIVFPNLFSWLEQALIGRGQ